MRNPAVAKAVVLCAALVLTFPWAQAQWTAPEAGVPVGTGVPSVPATPPAPLADPVAEAFAALDRDGDGKVSAVEHAEGAKARFDALDADHNYHLSAAEMERATGTDATMVDQLAAGMAATTANASDDNDNGEISPEESRAQAEAEFLARDADRDGGLSLEEMRRVVAPAGAPIPDN